MRKTLFELIPRVYFIGRSEYMSLYQTVFNGAIARWLIDIDNIDICANTAKDQLQKSLASTWVCGITDSMDISGFYHINQLEGKPYRPDWNSLVKFSNKPQILKTMKKQYPQLNRIVLLEDFVGTGSQMERIVSYAATLSHSAPVPIMLCPLIICRSGYERSLELEKTYSNLTFEPTLVLDDSVLLTINAGNNEDDYLRRLRTVVFDTYDRVKGSNSKNMYGPFGYGSNIEGGGLLLVLFSNCPDNTIPLIHHESDSPWSALFPRSSRI